MLKAVKASLAFMTPKERSKWYLLTTLRALLSLLDLAGILAIGFIIASIAVFLTSGSDPERVLEVGGLSIPAVNASSLTWVASGVLFMFLSKALFSMLLTRAAALFVAGVESKAARQIAKIALGSDLNAARLRSREEVVFAVQNGAPSAFSVLFNQVGTIIAEGALFVVVAAGFFFVDPTITLVAMAYFGLIAGAIQFFVGTLMNRAGEKIKSATILANTSITDLVSVFRELSVLQRRDEYITRVYKHRSDVSKNGAVQYFLSGMPRYVIEAALLMGLALFVLAQAVSGDLVSSAATIGVFLSGGFRLTAAMLPLQSALLTIKGVVPQAMAAHEILIDSPKAIDSDVDSKIKPTVGESKVTSDSGVGVEFRKVYFTYPGQAAPTIADVSMKIVAGSQIALIGPSGSGKSTIADIMCGLLIPSSGTVSLATTSTHDSHTPQLSVSYVPQRPGLVAGSIANNVALGMEDALVDQDRVLECLSRARLSSVIDDLPDGIHSDLGKFQDSLSGGQAQRLGLARALYTRPRLLVMDEATSALDAESESEISEALDELRGSVTVVLIAHRLHTIQHADQVFLIEQGQVSDSGKFSELLDRNSSVRRLVELMDIKRD
jgi:ABC-type bacteriocin/lantibiotic exporter with double-glycine peptidase domain